MVRDSLSVVMSIFCSLRSLWNSLEAYPTVKTYTVSGCKPVTFASSTSEPTVNLQQNWSLFPGFSSPTVENGPISAMVT